MRSVYQLFRGSKQSRVYPEGGASATFPSVQIYQRIAIVIPQLRDLESS